MWTDGEPSVKGDAESNAQATHHPTHRANAVLNAETNEPLKTSEKSASGRAAR